MPKLLYWVSKRSDGDTPKNIRTKTETECKTLQQKENSRLGEFLYAKPEKVWLEYHDGFDLMNLCMSGVTWIEDFSFSHPSDAHVVHG